MKTDKEYEREKQTEICEEARHRREMATSAERHRQHLESLRVQAEIEAARDARVVIAVAAGGSEVRKSMKIAFDRMIQQYTLLGPALTADLLKHQVSEVGATLRHVASEAAQAYAATRGPGGADEDEGDVDEPQSLSYSLPPSPARTDNDDGDNGYGSDRTWAPNGDVLASGYIVHPADTRQGAGELVIDTVLGTKMESSVESLARQIPRDLAANVRIDAYMDGKWNALDTLAVWDGSAWRGTTRLDTGKLVADIVASIGDCLVRFVRVRPGDSDGNTD